MEDDILAAALEKLTPRMRQYSRFLCGSPSNSDDFVLAALRLVVDNREAFGTGASLNLAIFCVLHDNIVRETDPDSVPLQRSQSSSVRTQLENLEFETKSAVLLATLGGFSSSEVAVVLKISASEADKLVVFGLAALRPFLDYKVLVIEDALASSFQLESILAKMGLSYSRLALSDAKCHGLVFEKDDTTGRGRMLKIDQSARQWIGSRTRTDIPVFFVSRRKTQIVSAQSKLKIIPVPESYGEAELKYTVWNALTFSQRFEPI